MGVGDDFDLGLGGVADGGAAGGDDVGVPEANGLGG